MKNKFKMDALLVILVLAVCELPPLAIAKGLEQNVAQEISVSIAPADLTQFIGIWKVSNCWFKLGSVQNFNAYTELHVEGAKDVISRIIVVSNGLGLVITRAHLKYDGVRDLFRPTGGERIGWLDSGAIGQGLGLRVPFKSGVTLQGDYGGIGFDLVNNKLSMSVVPLGAPDGSFVSCSDMEKFK